MAAVGGGGERQNRMLRYRNIGLPKLGEKLADKPGSVGARMLPTAIPLGPELLQGSSHLPASSAGRVVACLFGVAPGGGCRVSPCRTLRSGADALPHPHPFFRDFAALRRRSSKHGTRQTRLCGPVPRLAADGR